MATIYKRVRPTRTGAKLKGRIWWISYTQFGRQERRTLGVSDQKIAELMKAEIERNIERGKAGLPQSYVDAYMLFEEYKRAVIKKKSVAYQRLMFNCLKPFLIYVQEKKRMNLARVSVRDMEEHMCTRCHLSASSWNKELREIRRLFQFAIDREYLAQNPAAKVPLQQMIQYSVNVFTPEELNLIFQHAHPPTISFYRILLYTGMRTGEARHLRWSDVDLTPGSEHIKIRNTTTHPTKTRRDRVIPLSGEAVTLLQELIMSRRLDTPFLFPGRGDKPRGTNRNAWVACLKRIEDQTGVKIDRGYHMNGLHLFRHTFASYALASGVDIRTVQEWLGHSTITMTLRYTNLLPNQRQEQIRKLDFGLNELRIRTEIALRGKEGTVLLT